MSLPMQTLVENVMRLLPTGMTQDVKQNIDAAIRAGFDSMNLSTREELEIQQKVLQRAREKVTQLENQVELLEKKLAAVIDNRDNET